jgi:hypothetical protein
MLADALADQFFSRQIAGRCRPGHGTGKVSREVYRKSGRLWFAHFRRLAGRLLLSDGAEPVDRQW